MRNELVITADYYYVVVHRDRNGTACIFNFPPRIFSRIVRDRSQVRLLPSVSPQDLDGDLFFKNLIITRRCSRASHSAGRYLSSGRRGISSVVTHSAFVQRVPEHPFVGQQVAAKTQRFQFLLSIVLVVSREGHPPLDRRRFVCAFPVERATALSLNFFDRRQTGVSQLVRVLVLRQRAFLVLRNRSAVRVDPYHHRSCQIRTVRLRRRNVISARRGLLT